MSLFGNMQWYEYYNDLCGRQFVRLTTHITPANCHNVLQLNTVLWQFAGVIAVAL